jgi:hypothetical protein
MKKLAIISTLLSAATAAPTFGLLSNAMCPKNGVLPAGAISPSLLVPISKKRPDEACGATTQAKVTPGDMCTIFNLDLPDTFNGKPTENQICNLVFELPNLFQAPFSHLSFSGPGHFAFNGYAIGVSATAETTYNNQPAPGPSPPNPPKVMVPGNSYVINSAPCGIPPGAGKVTVSGALCSDDSALSFYQSNYICPIGFYVIIS